MVKRSCYKYIKSFPVTLYLGNIKIEQFVWTFFFYIRGKFRKIKLFLNLDMLAIFFYLPINKKKEKKIKELFLLICRFISIYVLKRKNNPLSININK